MTSLSFPKLCFKLTHASCNVQLLSLVWPFCDPADCSPPSSSVHGTFQARILQWVVISFSSNVCVNIRASDTDYVLNFLTKMSPLWTAWSHSIICSLDLRGGQSQQWYNALWFCSIFCRKCPLCFVLISFKATQSSFLSFCDLCLPSIQPASSIARSKARIL